MLTRALPTVHFPEVMDESIAMAAKQDIHQEGLGCLVKAFLNQYLHNHKNHLPIGQLYSLVMEEVEKPLLEATLKMCAGNQKKASEILGINRNTLRKKMMEYQLEDQEHSKKA